MTVRWNRREFIRDLLSTSALGVGIYGVFFRNKTMCHPPHLILRRQLQIM